MIDIEELKPILSGLLEGREDSADVIAQITEIDKPYDKGYTEDDLNSRISSINDEWNEKFKKAFFGEKADTLTGDPEPAEGAPNNEAGGIDAEEISIADLFTKEEE